MSDHHAFGPGCSATGVVDGSEIAFADAGSRKVGRRRSQGSFVVEPALPFSFQGHEMVDTGHLRAYPVDRPQMIRMRTDDSRAAVVDDVGKIIGRQPAIDRDESRANLQDRVERLELSRGVGSDVGNAITRSHSELLKGRRPAVAPLKELPI